MTIPWSHDREKHPAGLDLPHVGITSIPGQKVAVFAIQIVRGNPACDKIVYNYCYYCYYYYYIYILCVYIIIYIYTYRYIRKCPHPEKYLHSQRHGSTRKITKMKVQNMLPRNTCILSLYTRECILCMHIHLYI